MSIDRRDFLTGMADSGDGVLAPAALGASAIQGAGEGGGGGSGASSDSARAMAELRDTLAGVEAGFAEPAWRLLPGDLPDARRYLSHTLQHALECWMEADPARPVFHRFVTPEKKLLGDNPDALYFTTAASAAHTYRIRGNVAGADYTSFTVELGTGDGSNSRRTGATLNDTEFEIAPDGSYEIVASAKPQPKNWLRLDPEAGSITTRHYYEREAPVAADRLHTIPLVVENSEPPQPPPAPDDASLAAGLRRVAAFVRSTIQPPAQGAEVPHFVSTVPNQLPAPQLRASHAEVGFAAVDNVYSMAPFAIPPGQALVMRGRFPSCRFANVVLWNRFMQTFDYLQRRVSLNRRQTKLEADGSFKMVLAAEDPGVPNWLDTEGRLYGTIFWRFLMPEEEIEPLRASLVPLSEVAGA